MYLGKVQSPEYKEKKSLFTYVRQWFNYFPVWNRPQEHGYILHGYLWGMRNHKSISKKVTHNFQ